MAAYTLGIASPPGSLLLTLLGWPIAHMPFIDSPAHALNLLAALLAALATTLVAVAGMSILRLPPSPARPGGPAAIGAGLGALTLAFSGTLWAYATRFTPYVLTTAFTGLVLLTMLRWWKDADSPDAWRWIALLALLFGLDFSVHRTNALLIPGAVAWVLARRPRAVIRPPIIAAAAAGLVAGLAVQLLLIPVAAFTHSSLDFSLPSDLSRFLGLHHAQAARVCVSLRFR